MIYIRLRGRAGNQLFIYALARSLNLKYQQPVTICTRIDDKRDLKFKSFNNDLLEFNISNDIVFDNQFKFPWYANNDFLLVKFFRKLMPSLIFSILARFNVFLWLKESYKEINISTSKDAYIDGFWQSEKYFSDNISQIIHCDFLMKKGIRKENHHFLKEIEENESVCVTIRRGDYLSNESIKRKYYVCDEQYFKKAMKIMKKIIPNAKFVFFSDDISWVKNNIEAPEGSIFETGNDTVAEKLYLMSKCKYFILSNSSFSWWAQELCVNSSKVVISPKYWYKDKRKCDIYNEGWILL